jgi:elongation factor 3
MARVTFVQSVESSALAMVVPLLLHGQKEKKITTKRKSYSKEVSKDNP